MVRPGKGKAAMIFKNFQQNALLFFIKKASQNQLKKVCNETVYARKIQQQVLKNILNLQKNTDYGKKYNFAAIRSAGEFQASLPLSNYETYRYIIEDIANTGNFNQLIAEPIIYFQETSGTTGRSKLIPRTKRLSLTVQKVFQASEAILQSYYFKEKAYTQKNCALALANAQPLKYTNSGIPKGTGTSGGIKQSKLFQKIVSLLFSSPPSVFLIPNYKTAYYCHLLFALLKSDITHIAANFASNVLEAMQILEKDWSHLVEDIHHGRINEGLNLDRAIRNEFQSYLMPNPSRAKELRDEFERGFKDILPRIWPQLSYIQCITTGAMHLYKENLQFYANNIPFYSGGYGASEAWIGINLEPQSNSSVYVVTPHSAFFEFIPVSEIDADSPSTVDLTSLSVGESYEVVVTTVAGLYRYRMADIVKCVSYYNQSPVLEFLYRRGSLLNISGEKISEDEIYTAVTEAIKVLGNDCKIIDYTTRVDFSSCPFRYIIYIEISHKLEWPLKLVASQEKLEQVLCELNILYFNCRKAGSIGLPEIKLVENNTFKALKEKIIFPSGFSESQFKMPRFLKDSELIQFLEKSVE